MPMRKSRHMANFREVMVIHAPVVTDATTSGGWIGWMPAKMSPATKAAKPLQRMRLEDVTFILLSFLRRLRAGRRPSRRHDRDQHDAQKAVSQRFCPPEAHVRIQPARKQQGQPESHNPDGLPHELEEKQRQHLERVADP